MSCRCRAEEKSWTIEEGHPIPSGIQRGNRLMGTGPDRVVERELLNVPGRYTM